MHIRMLLHILALLCRKNDRQVLFTDGNRQYGIVDIDLDDKNPYIYVHIEEA